MCGIVGVIAKEKEAFFLLEEIKEMNKMQKHRGPDDSGITGISLEKTQCINIGEDTIFKGKSVVAFNRLSIQDISVDGHQPMMNKEKSVALAFNGEIYNFKELREGLISRGYIFKSGSDTEVILNLYLEYGIEQTLKKLNGMFAFILYDSRICKMYVVRDRFGIKPMYMANLDNFFLFASEVKSFLKFHEFEAKLETDRLQEYILFRSIIGGCLLKGVEQVLPGEVFEISLLDNRLMKWNYFDINSYCRNESNENDNKIKENFWEVFSQAVKRQMISDVKVGCQLSGGIDSTLVSYIASERYNMSDTISVVVDDERFSEEAYIDHVAAKLQAVNYKLNLGQEYYTDNFVNSIWHFEGVTVHPSTLGVYKIAEEAKKYVTVLLSGEGADEVFAGYKCFTEHLHTKKKEGQSLKEDYVISAHGKIDNVIAKYFYPHIEIENQMELRRDIYKMTTGSLLDRQIKYEMKTYLPELLIRQDKMSMAHSIENRVPFLDNEVVDYAFNIPERLIINKKTGQGKDILKQLCIPLFGKDFAYRKKRGFGMPTNMFIFSKPKFAERVVKNLQRRSIFNEKAIEEWSKKVISLKGLDAELFFKLIGFEVWCELFLDKKNIEEVKEGVNS